MRSHVVCASLCAVLLGAAARASAQTPYYTNFGDHTLRRAEVIVLGGIESVGPTVRGAQVVRVQVRTSYKGQVGPEVVVMAGSGEFFEGSEQLLFLATYRDGPRFSFINRISRSDPDFEAKEHFLRQNLEVEQLVGAEARRDRVRRLLYENAQSMESWTRWNMLRELSYVLRTYPDLLRPEDREALRKVAASSTDRRFGDDLQRQLREQSP